MSPNELLAFGRSFGLAQPLFSFVDVGGGKERADHKLREHLRLYLRIGQCKHIFFAPCHDNGYLPVLESYRREHASRMTLIETRPAEPGYVELGLRRIQMPTLFRSDNLPGGPVKSMPTVALEAPKNFAGMPNAVLSPQPKKLPNRTGLSTQAQNAAIMPKSPSPAPSNESNGSSWATIGKNGGPTKTINIAPQKKPDRKFILVNRYNERIDEDLPRTDPAAENRFQKRTETYGKHCNSYHLLGRCERGEYCDYHHGEKLTAGERLVLKHKARSLSCPKKIACADPICPYGHHCKYGGGHCYFDRCYYADTHTMDLEPAKKIYDDGSEEWLPNYLEKSR
ncbi:hypothetical protein CKM354_000239800 [Cercospora kikuchii]|uniref:C3H1-type domain-containing protein n=1 Tax=Cercospora kikuchii TaxID=84275 RepID=A0A9P3CEN2_9PEZI|nr:uncharacterized protein CKM354_000239800 [Cercospora kikuchii]GIZ39005.1 hypothetical protein CKM354_000239800 [Cercospora kikuchii]